MQKINKILRAVPLWTWLVAFTIIPLLMILYYSVFDQTDEGVVITFKYLKEAVTNPLYLKAMGIAFKYAIICTIICFILGYPLAYVLTKISSRWQGFAILMMMLPMWVNFVIRTWAMKSVLEKDGLLDNFFVMLGAKSGAIITNDVAIIVVLVYNFLPFLVLPIYTSMMKIDSRLIEAAQDLGANQAHVLRKIMIPLTIPGIVSGITMVFMPAVTTFVVPQMMANKTQTIGSLIEEKFRLDGVSNSGAALSFVLMIFIIISMSIVGRIDKDGNSGGVI